MTAPKPDGAPTLSDQLDRYLALDHRDNLAGGCAMAASASEIARQDDAVSARFAEGFEQMVGAVQAALEVTMPTADDRARALTIAAAMIGGVAMARAAAKSRSDLSDEIMAAVRRVLGEVGGEGGEPPWFRADWRGLAAGRHGGRGRFLDATVGVEAKGLVSTNLDETVSEKRASHRMRILTANLLKDNDNF